MKICFVVPNLNVGGQERLTIWLAQHFRSLGHEVCIVCLSGKGALLPECRERSIEVIIPAAPYRASFLQFDLLRWLRRFFRQCRPDVVHSHAFEANYYARLAGLGLPGAFFAHEHNIYPNKRTVHFAIDSLLSRKSARVICISHAVAEFHIRHEKLDRAKVSVIWNGVPWERGKATRSRRQVREELGIADATPVLIATGSFKPQKGHTILIDALARMENRDSILLLAGSGPLKRNVENWSCVWALRAVFASSVVLTALPIICTLRMLSF
jgi:glycosyltransferase involved in cell wall biosynthesis